MGIKIDDYTAVNIKSWGETKKRVKEERDANISNSFKENRKEFWKKINELRGREGQKLMYVRNSMEDLLTGRGL